MSDSINLDEIRNNINEIDEKIAVLFEQRMENVKKVAEYKIANGKPILDEAREKAVIERNVAYIKNEDLKPYYVSFIKDMMKISRVYQKNLTEVVGVSKNSKKILVINGSNLNMLGIREPGIYGNDNYEVLCEKINQTCERLGIDVEIYQSNHEGDLVDKIQSAYGNVSGIVINPGAYTHTSVAILDALKAVSIPTVEVHISDVDSRENFRQVSYVGLYAVKTIKGKGIDGYVEAIEYLNEEVIK